jgi:hypothetical protein
MLAGKSAREEMGRRARERAECLYGRETHYARIEAIYRDVIAAKRPR